MKSTSSLRDEFVHGGVPILFIKTLREGSPNVGHSVSCTVVYPKNMQGLKGVVHKRRRHLISPEGYPLINLEMTCLESPNNKTLR